ncbi:MAG: HPr(Ser) kinase/phosphatase [bacterium]
MNLIQTNIVRKENITVEYFYKNIKDKFKLSFKNEEVSLNRLITDQNMHRPGLALAGFVELFTHSRVQIFGNTEVKYLNNLSEEERINSLEKIFKFTIPCVIITNNNKVPDKVIETATKYKIPVFTSPYLTTKLAYLISDFLDDQFSPQVTVHGSFADVYGAGILFVGKSGIGKSEVALDLVERGHRLVADDVIIFTKKGEGILMGSGTDLVGHFMEIRGVGLIDVRSMFGVRAIRFQKRLEVVIELELWDDQSEYTRLGLENPTINILDTEIPYIKLPIIPGKNITVISEVIALNYLLKHYGYDASKVFRERLNEKIRKNTSEIDRTINYFEHDFE